MSATASAAGVPQEPRPATARPRPGARVAPVQVPKPARESQPAREPSTGTASGTRSPAPATAARTVRPHSAPVRTGSLRSRPVARPQATGPVPGPVPATAPGRVRRMAAAAQNTRRAPFVLLVVGLLVTTALGLLFLNTAIAVNSLKATQLRLANADRAQEVQRLEQQVVSGSTPAELASDAEEAGLVPAGAAGYLVIGEDGTGTLRGEPVPAEDPDAPESED